MVPTFAIIAEESFQRVECLLMAIFAPFHEVAITSVVEARAVFRALFVCCARSIGPHSAWQQRTHVDPERKFVSLRDIIHRR